jgi:hypothetical protein
VVAAVLAGELGLLVGAHGADHGGAEGLRPLADDQADAAGRGVDEDGVARLHAIGAPQQVLGGEALHHDRRALLEGQASGSFTSSSAAMLRASE